MLAKSESRRITDTININCNIDNDMLFMISYPAYLLYRLGYVLFNDNCISLKKLWEADNVWQLISYSGNWIWSWTENIDTDTTNYY